MHEDGDVIMDPDMHHTCIAAEKCWSKNWVEQRRCSNPNTASRFWRRTKCATLVLVHVTTLAQCSMTLVVVVLADYMDDDVVSHNRLICTKHRVGMSSHGVLPTNHQQICCSAHMLTSMNISRYTISQVAASRSRLHRVSTLVDAYNCWCTQARRGFMKLATD